MPGHARRRYTTYLVALSTGRDDDVARGATVVYAVMARAADDALAAVRALAEAPATVAVVGSLSTRTAKAIKLKPGEVRAV